MSEFLTQLVEMGFSEERAKMALKETGETGLEAAMDWILSHSEDTVQTKQQNEEKPKEAEDVDDTVRSYKCDDCGKTFPNEAAVEFHAVKSGHSNFSQSNEAIAPLSEEERRKRAEDLMTRIKAARAAKEKAEAAEAIEKEKKRRIEGRAMQENRERQQEMEMRKIAEERRREKEEEKAAKARILEQIRLDKEARKARETGERAPEPAGPSYVVQPPPKVDPTQARIQIRLPNGQSLTNTFGPDETLAAVRVWLEVNNHAPDFSKSFNFFSPADRKVFKEEDFEAPLSALGLAPSAVLIVRSR